MGNLIDHLVRAGEQRGGHFEAKSFCGFEIDYKLDLRCLHNGEVSRLVAAENPAGVNSCLTVGVHLACARTQIFATASFNFNPGEDLL